MTTPAARPTPTPIGARNLQTSRWLAERVRVATTRRARAVGLLGSDRLARGGGLLISPCRGVHTCGMRYPIDVVALDAAGTVVDLVAALRPWRFRLPTRGAIGVLELPAGTLARTATRRGHRIALEPMPREVTP